MFLMRVILTIILRRSLLSAHLVMQICWVRVIAGSIRKSACYHAYSRRLAVLLTSDMGSQPSDGKLCGIICHNWCVQKDAWFCDTSMLFQEVANTRVCTTQRCRTANSMVPSRRNIYFP